MRALGIIGVCLLIGGTATVADIQMGGGLSYAWREEITKCTMPNTISVIVDNTSANNDGLQPIYHIPIKFVLRHFIAKFKSGSESSGRIDHLAIFIWNGDETLSYVFIHFFIKGGVNRIYSLGNYIPGEIKRWLSSGISHRNRSDDLLVWFRGNSTDLCIHGTNPSPTGSDRGLVRVVGGLLRDKEAKTYEYQSDSSNSCPNGCDPIQAFGGPKLSRPELFFGGLVLFFGFMYFSNKGLERHPFGAQHVGCWFGAVIGACFGMLASLPMIMRWVWSLL